MNSKEDCLSFWVDLWSYASSLPPILPSKIISDVYEIGTYLHGDEEDMEGVWADLCWCCYDLSKVIKKRLPENLHSRMALGGQNVSTRRYFKWLKESNDVCN